MAVEISSDEDYEKEVFTMSSQQMDKFNDMVYEGMFFYSEKQAYDIYNEYARKVVFSIRRDKYQKRSDGSIRSRIFVCFKEGQRRHNPNIVRQIIERIETGTGCRARLVVKRDGT